MEQIVRIAEEHVAGVFEAEARVILPSAEDRLPTVQNGDGPDSSVAQWVYDREQPAGFGTGTLAATRFHYLPLRAPMRTRGVLALAPRNERLIFVPEQHRLLETFATQIALALERVHFVEVAQTAELGMASEQLRNSLLASISHDLRTPLAVLSGAASSLVEEEARLPAEARRELVHTIYDQARHMSELASNVLDMARLESGAVTINRQWHPVEEVVGPVLNRFRTQLAGRLLRVDLDTAPTLVWVDAVLMGQVITNLLDNALKYTPPGSPIELCASTHSEGFTMWLADSGPGIVPGDEGRVFEKFYRSRPEGATGGAGLGLSICRAIVLAHGGRIWAENRVEGGARFTLVIPQPTPPKGPEPERDAAGMPSQAS
jgi:two-component system sensor histidine kinase KdpD